MSPQDKDAELLQLLSIPEDDSGEELVEEGKDQPRPVASGKESTAEVAPELVGAETPGDEDSRDKRYQQLLGRLKRMEKFEPLIEMFEEEPDLARAVAARKLGLTREAPVAAPSAPVAPTAEEQEQLRQYWAGRFEQDPVGALSDLIQASVIAQTQGTRVASAKSLVANYKATRRTDDPRFKHYEPYFDEFVKSANMDLITRDPDNALAAIENLALGTWARDQSRKASVARTKAPATSPRETPRSLDTSQVSGASAPARPKRQLTEEEQNIVRMYGEDVIDGLLESDEEEVFAR